jgi:carboxymethylenebutenolidase
MPLAADITIEPGLTGYYIHAGRSDAPAIVVLIEAFGLTAHIRRVCDRIAAHGYHALAPDLYEGEVFGYEGDQFDAALAKMRALDPDRVLAQIGQSLAFLGREKHVDADRLGVIGFCMGGRYAFLANTEYPATVRAAVSFYGAGIAPADASQPSALARAERLQHPSLLIYGGRDPSIPPAEHGRIAARLSELHKPYTLSVYPEAGHGFACEDRGSYHAASATRAFEEALHFFGRCFAG